MIPTEWVIATNTGLQERGQALFTSEGQVLEAENIAWFNEAALQMRMGSEAESLTSSGLTGEVQWLQSFLPNGPEELWGASDNSGTAAMARRVSGTWNTVTISDTLTAANLRYTQSAALNGKLFLAYDSDVNRLHVWDGTSLRRVGLIVPSAPSVANTGAGAYAATARRYRVSTRIKSGSDIVVESELSSATAFTPSGAGTAARVSRPTTYESTATHWVVWGLISSSGDTYDLYEELSEIAIATTTYDDSTAPSSYDGDFPPELALNVPPPSAKYIVSDGSRLLMAGAWETSAAAGQTTPKVNRVWFTRVLGASDRGDDETIPNTLTLKNYIDVGDASAITAVVGPLYGEVYIFKRRTIYKLVPTGDSTTPYSAVLVSDTSGCVNQRVACMGTNQDGRPAIYFSDEHALQMISDGGLSPVGLPITRDLRATSVDADAGLIAYDTFQQQILFQISPSPAAQLGSYNAFLLDVLKQRWAGFSLGGASGGWTLGSDALDTAAVLSGSGSTIVAATVGSISATSTRRLILGGQDANAAGAVTNIGGQCVLDGATTFTSRVRMRRVLKPGYRFQAYNPTIWYTNPQGSTAGTLTATLMFLRPASADGEAVTVSQSATLSTTADENGVEIKEHTFEGVQWADMSVMDVRLQLSYSGTAFLSANPPTVWALVIPVAAQEPLSR